MGYERRNYRWQILTKRIGNATKMLPPGWADGYPNVWIGATMVNQEEVDRDLGKLVRTAARTRFVSLEPLLGPLSLNLDGVDWVIVGGESGRNRREVDVQWIEGVVEQCRAARVPVFVKQDSGPRPGMKGRITDELWLKEFPESSITRSNASPMPECGVSAS